MVVKWLSAQDDHKQLRVFVEQSLARPFNEDTEPLTPSQIRANALPLREIPTETHRLAICAIDVQKGWLSVHVLLFASPAHAVIVDRREFYGDIDRLDGSAWTQCKDWLNTKPMYNGFGVKSTVIDTSWQTDMTVLNGTRMRQPRTYFVKGGHGFNHPLIKQAVNPRIRGLRYPLLMVGVDGIKRSLRKWYGTGQFRIVDTLPENVERELTSEVLVKHKSHGRIRPRWEQIDERNEALDASVYAIAALHAAGYTQEMIGRIARKVPKAKAKAKARRPNTLERLRATGDFS